MLQRLMQDETGFIISAELVMVATILVIGVIVGLSEVQHAVVGELNDVADAIGSANQSYGYSGFSKVDGGWGFCGGTVHAWTVGSSFVDLQDACDLNQCQLACNPPVIEFPKCDHGIVAPHVVAPVAPHVVAPTMPHVAPPVADPVPVPPVE